jgi:putative transposase
MRALYQSSTDLSDAQWDVLAPLLPARKWRFGEPGRPPCTRRWVINGIVYVNKPEWQRRMLPADFGPWQTVSGYFLCWCRAGVWTRLMRALRQWECRCQGRLAKPSAGCIDSQGIKTATQGKDTHRHTARF